MLCSMAFLDISSNQSLVTVAIYQQFEYALRNGVELSMAIKSSFDFSLFIPTKK